MGEMRMTRLDPETARRLLDGRLWPDDAPPGFSGVANLLDAARDTASEPGSVGEATTVAAMQAIVVERLDTPTIDPRRRHMRKKVLAAKTAAATTVVLLGAGTAAAATGSLPGAAQSTASDMLSKIGVSVPGNNNDHANSRGQSGDSGTNGPTGSTGNTGNTGSSNRQGNGPNSHAFPGLCRAQIASAGHPDANSVVPGINCSGVTPAGGGTGTTSGTNQPSSTPDGPPSSTPASGKAPVSTPNQGSANTSSGSDNSSNGLGTAAGHGDASSTGAGAASAGGGNAGSRP
jgi:hypothetical protein